LTDNTRTEVELESAPEPWRIARAAVEVYGLDLVAGVDVTIADERGAVVDEHHSRF